MEQPLEPRGIPSPTQREWLLEAFARGLGPGEHIVKLCDVYRSSGRHTLQLPLDATAEVLLSEPPLLEPGGITEMRTYVKVRDRTIRETTIQNGLVLSGGLKVVRPDRSPDPVSSP